MSQTESKVDGKYTEYASGDSNRMSKQFEENNNVVESLSKDLQMGCIVDAVKRPPNICMETCVHEEKEEHSEEPKTTVENLEDGYSDEFEEGSDNEDSLKNEVDIPSNSSREPTSSLKLRKSQSSSSTNKPPASNSGRSTSYGSLPVPQTRRVNMSFSNDRLREIERHNHILLTKILSARNTRKSSIPSREAGTVKGPTPSAALHRKQQQRKIDHENLILLKKIQRAKSSSCSVRR